VTSARTGSPRSWAPASWANAAAVLLPLRVARTAGVRDRGVGAGRRLADRADRGLRRALGPVSRTGPGVTPSNPVMAQFWGAPAMALMTVGAGDAGPRPGPDRARPRSASTGWLWLAGTALGLVTAVWNPVPDDHGGTTIGAGDAFGGWLMPVVPADGLGGHRRAADPARGIGPGPADAAAGVLRDVRHQPVRPR